MTNETPDESLLATHRRMIEAVRSGDLPTVLSIYADDVVLMPPNDTSIYGKAEVSEWWKEYVSHFTITGLGEADRDVTIIGDWAIERYSYQVAIQPTAEGDRIMDEGRFLNIWKRDATGQWQIAQQIWNSSRPIGSGTSRFMALLKQRWSTPSDT